MVNHVSEQLFVEAKSILVGGVNSPVRAFNSVGGTPIFFEKGQGAYLTSADGDDYLDYVLSWGPMILGHAHPVVEDALIAAIKKGTSFGAPTEAETKLSVLIQSFFPSMEKIRLVNSGTEACMSAIRLVRGFTGRKRILKFEGCYHGHADALLVAAGSGALTLGQPDSAGVLPELAQFTTVLPYNDAALLETFFAEHGSEVAGVIVEPVAGNMGLVVPTSEFLLALRRLCSQYDAILIFDEVMTGFRVALGGAQALFEITPDLTCLGKVIGGGLPCAAYGGRADIMNFLSPDGPVYQAGTLSGNPLAMAAGISTLSQLRDTNSFLTAATHTTQLCGELSMLLRSLNLAAQVISCGTMWTLFFTDRPILNLADAKRSDVATFARFFHKMLVDKIVMAPSQFESNFVSACHGARELAKVVDAFRRSLS